MAPLVVSRMNGDTRALGGLFAGLSFFLVQRLPSRSSFVEKVQNNGGRVVKLEVQADHVIADHVRRDCPPGSISFTFIDVAIRDGTLPHPSDHTAGPSVGAIRDVGSIVPGKQTRTAFTLEDDRVLWQWVKQAQEQGGLAKGNDIYKQLEARNPRHTFQAWRDRYIKKLMDRPPAGVVLKVAANAPPTPPEALDQEADVMNDTGKGKQKASSPANKRTLAELESAARVEPPGATFRLPRGSQMPSQSPVKSSLQKPGRKPHVPGPMDDDDESQGEDFDDGDFEALLGQAEFIVTIDENRTGEAWQAWAQAYKSHTADEWQEFWEDKVQPEYMRRVEERREAKRRRRERKARRLAENARAAEASEADDTSSLLVKAEPASSQKRKRTTPTSRAKATYSQKKHRPDVSSLFEDDIGDAGAAASHIRPEARLPAKSISPVRPSTEPIEILSDSEDEEEIDDRSIPEAELAHQTAKVDDAMQMDQAMPSDLPTSEVMLAADQQMRRESRELQHIEIEPTSSQQRISNLPTSDANRAAEQQIRRESHDIEAMEVEVAASPRHDDSNLLTSDANHAAAQQLRRESVDPDLSLSDEVYEDTSPQRPASQLTIPEPSDNIVISNHLVEDGEVEDGLPGEEFVHIDEGGDALTEANLASQQALHKKQLLRGADLPEDDEMEDQSDFVSYLRQQLPSKQVEAKVAPIEAVETPKLSNPSKIAAALPSDVLLDQRQATHDAGHPIIESAKPTPPIPAPVLSDREADDLLDQTRYTHNDTGLDRMDDELDALVFPELPLSSQHEVDEVFETNLQWPSSPQAPLRKPKTQPETQSLPFETQIAYPNLIPEDAEDDEQMFSSQPAQPDDVTYPALLGQSKEARINTGLYFSSGTKAQRRPEPLPQADHRDDPEDVGDSIVRKPTPVNTQSRGDNPPADDVLGDDINLSMPSEDEEYADSEQEDEIDLTIAEPEGGFGFSSPPAKSVASQPDQTIDHPSPAASVRSQAAVEESEDELDEDELPAEEQHEPESEAEAVQPDEGLPQEVIEVSSASSSSSSYVSSAPSSSAPDEEQVPGKALETQDILDAETQPLDLELPLPPDSDEEFEELPSGPLAAPSPPPNPIQLVPAARPQPPLQSSRTQRPAHPRSIAQQASLIDLTDTQTLDDDEVDDYIITMTVRYKFTESAIVEALRCTSMRPAVAELVLLEEKAGNGLPANIRGVWTKEEDEVIESGDARGMRAVTEKHGWDEMEGRLRFLEEWRSG
ncbi:hypothetical protein LTR36_006332 [Oleoguttula mirabilis]|uniref:Telomeric repeat-binding factor 2-interacting protein 1 n=1 Tax=Oleoguttula mirabilis TaxID=1507867 RepID=A0AAV9JW88_9PEZI|nr:hypothetical protein LTR36_006332 [Oleoguttula mirabilis]